MVITLQEIIAVLPIIIIGVIIIIILLSLAYRRNQLFHAGLTIFGLFLSILSFGILWHYQDVCNVFPCVCINKHTIFYGILVLSSSLMSSILSYKWLLRYPSNHCDEFYLLLLISSMGGVLLVVTNHLAILFIGMELFSLPLFGLIGYYIINKFSLEASIKYIILSGVSSSFLLLGMALVYVETGCLSFTQINQSLLIVKSVFLYQPVLILGLSIMLIGFGIKLSFVPFHLWTPDVYQGAPYPISMYLITSGKVAIVSVLTRFFLVFSEQYNEIFNIFLSGVACGSILLGNLMAVYQNSIKRILAYSSISNTGYLLIGLIILKKYPIVLESMGVYFISYLIANIGIFSVISLISNIYNNTYREADSLMLYQGLFWKNPTLSIFFTTMLLSLAGIPMTLGFIGKFYLFMLSVNSQLWYLIFFMIISSIIAIFYCFKIMIHLYLYPKKHIFCPESTIFINWICTIEGVIICISSFLILFLGIYPQPIIYCVHSIF